jgi:competence protein ComEC
VLLGVVLLGISDQAAALPLSLAVGTLDLVWPWLERAANLPIALWMTAPRPLWVLLVAQLGLLLCVAPRGFPGRWLAWPLMLPLFAWRPATPAQDSYEVTVLDVGQGLAVVVRTAHHALLYDAGPSFRSGGDTGRLVVVPYLRSRGIQSLDAMIISHDDDDHSGGAASVRSLVGIAREITGGRGGGERCVAGRGWRWDGVDFALLHPRAGERWSDNDGSCVLRVSGRGGSVLLTGDIEQSGERALVESGATLTSDLVVAPHHGSASSSSVPLIALAHARYVAFSTGFGNRWGFPKSAVQSRWRAAGATLHDTARSGALIYRVDQRAGVRPPSRHRYDARHYWTSD